MQTENKMPLYKVLNEQRTQGKWYCEDGSFEVRQTSFQRIGIMDSITGQVNNTQRTANAQYTALAVNNLHLLAEALEKIKNECLKALARQAAGEEFSLKSLIGAIAETSVDALIRIS